MRVAILFSGGKDSAYAAFLARRAWHELAHLVTFLPDNPESFMFHSVNVRLTPTLAGLMRVPHLAVRTHGEKEEEVRDIEQALSGLGVEGVVTGAVASTYQKKRVDAVCEKLGISHVSPLWGKDQKALLLGQLHAGFDAIIVGVAAAGFDESWLGRRIDEKCVQDLEKLHEKHGVSLSGEGGEYETLVVDCPLYARPLKIIKTKKVWLGDRGVLEVEAK